MILAWIVGSLLGLRAVDIFVRHLVLRDPKYYDWLLFAFLFEPEGAAFQVVEGPFQGAVGRKLISSGWRPGYVTLIVPNHTGRVVILRIRRASITRLSIC